MEHMRDWIDILQALLTPTIALIAVGIGLAQWWTARNRLKLDLFDTRWSVYGVAGVRRLIISEAQPPARESAQNRRVSRNSIGRR